MTTKIRTMAGAFVIGAMLAGCASNPKNIEAAYVSPSKYESFSCDQIAAEKISVDQRTQTLYQSLRKRRKGDNAKMAVGLVLFWPALFFLKGNGAKQAEFAQLKGDYYALRTVSNQKTCGVQFRDSFEGTK